MRRVSSQLSRELEREPTDDELSQELGLSCGKVSQLRTDSLGIASLDAPVGATPSPNLAKSFAMKTLEHRLSFSVRRIGTMSFERVA